MITMRIDENKIFSQIFGDINQCFDIYAYMYMFLLLWNPSVNYNHPIEGTPPNGILDSRYAFRVFRDTQFQPINHDCLDRCNFERVESKL